MLISLLENYRMAGLFMPGAWHSSKHTLQHPASEAEPPTPQQVLLPAAKTVGDESARTLGALMRIAKTARAECTWSSELSAAEVFCLELERRV